MGAALVGPHAFKDGVDQIRLAQAPEAVEPHLIGDRVQVRQRARLQLGALKYSHVSSPDSELGGWRPLALDSERHP
jgi:hypothetical protein